MYVVHWRRARGFDPISAWNDVFVVDTSSKSRKAAAFWMNEQEPDTQTRSSERLEARFRNGLKTPRVPCKSGSDSDNIMLLRSHPLQLRNLELFVFTFAALEEKLP
jgi:hypothetical protein